MLLGNKYVIRKPKTLSYITAFDIKNVEVRLCETQYFLQKFQRVSNGSDSNSPVMV